MVLGHVPVVPLGWSHFLQLQHDMAQPVIQRLRPEPGHVSEIAVTIGSVRVLIQLLWSRCNPQGVVPVALYGVAVQSSTVPAPASCTNGGLPCTSPCSVLGTGLPVYQLQNYSDPATGGVVLTHRMALEFDTDQWKCPFDPSIGSYRNRSITYVIDCDLAEQDLAVLDFTEGPVCSYTLLMRSKYACGFPFLPPVCEQE